MQSIMTTWGPLIGAAATLVVAFTTLRATSRQIRALKKIEERKVRLALFDRRHEIYKGVEAALIRLNPSDDVYSEAFTPLVPLFQDAYFLIGPEISRYIQEDIYNKMVDMQYGSPIPRSLPWSPDCQQHFPAPRRPVPATSVDGLGPYWDRTFSCSLIK